MKEYKSEENTTPQSAYILSDCEKVINAELFVSTHTAIIENENVNKKVKQPYIDRLIKFQTLLNQTQHNETTTNSNTADTNPIS